VPGLKCQGSARPFTGIAYIARDRRDRGKGKSFTAKDAKDAE